MCFGSDGLNDRKSWGLFPEKCNCLFSIKNSEENVRHGQTWKRNSSGSGSEYGYVCAMIEIMDDGIADLWRHTAERYVGEYGISVSQRQWFDQRGGLPGATDGGSQQHSVQEL